MINKTKTNEQKIKTNGIKKLGHKNWKSAKVLKRESSLREIFKNRTNVYLGLTKKEIISLYFNQDIRIILSYPPPKIDKLWNEINVTRVKLRRERLMAIVPLLMPSGTRLDDSSLDNAISSKPRVLTLNNYVYHSCSDMNTALSIRKSYDKIMNGIEKAGEDIEEITEEGIKQRQIIQTIQPIRN